MPAPARPTSPRRPSPSGKRNPQGQPKQIRGQARRAPPGRARPAAAIPGLRRARPSDLDALMGLEEACFQPHRRASRASVRRSIGSPRQSAWVVERSGRPAALLVLWHFPHRVRVYDIATHPDFRHEGLGRRLMAKAEADARTAGAAWMTLEAEAADQRLVAWYEGQGYAVAERLPDFYPGGRAAVRMRKRL